MEENFQDFNDYYEGVPLVKTPSKKLAQRSGAGITHLLFPNVKRNLAYDYTDYKNIIHTILTNFSSYKFITIRPHDYLIYGMYGAEYRTYLKRMFSDISNIIDAPFIGSCEKSNSKTIHFHLIIKCSTTQLNNYMELLKYIYTLKPLFPTQKQYAIQRQKLQDIHIERFISYYLGYKWDDRSLKPSFKCNVSKDFTYIDQEPHSYQLMIEKLETQITTRKIRSKKNKNLQDDICINISPTEANDF